MLVIVKQMLLDGKQTFKDFTESEEAIATNILSSKLKLLEALGIITKSKLPNNKKVNLYQLTERGLALAPIIVELAIWSEENLRDLHKPMRSGEELEQMKTDKEAFVLALKKNYREKVRRDRSKR